MKRPGRWPAQAFGLTEGFASEREAREHLRVLQRQLARLPFAYGVFDLVVIWMLLRQGLAWQAAVWLAVYGALQVVRLRYARGALHEPDALASVALRRLAWVMVLLGALRVGPVALLFSRPAPQEQVMLTLVYVGMAAAAVVSAGGRWRTFLAWATLACGSLAIGWALQGTWEGWAVAALIVALAATLAAYVHDQHRTLLTLVRLAHENEDLATSLRIERDRVAAASHSQTRFFAAASHDLRQPLHALAMNATALELLAQRRGDARIQELCAAIGQSLDQGQSLLDSLLDISRLDAGAVAPDWQSVSVADMLESVRQAYAETASAQGLWLRVELGDPSARVRADPALLRRILHNLVSNAIKYTDSGGVTLAATPSTGGRIRVTVADTGQGIAAEDQERVFEEFVQGQRPTRAAPEPGLGLGLAIVRRMARLMELPLRLTSAVDQGTQVELELQASSSQTVT